MSTEQAAIRIVHKPWGVHDLQPWSDTDASRDAVGELWFERADPIAQTPALLLKLLFTSSVLSIQVHPNDTYARAMGMPNGKSEAWYVLYAEEHAEIGVGLKRKVTPTQLASAIGDGTIVDLIQWLPVAKNDFVYIPAGTIHAIGAGIVLAEIQQHSDVTFRLFDYDRHRELHETHGLAVAHPWPRCAAFAPIQMTKQRVILLASPHFVIERVDLSRNSSWVLRAETEIWILALAGHAAIGVSLISTGQVVFVTGAPTDIHVGADGLTGLVAYPASQPADGLLQILQASNDSRQLSPVVTTEKSL